MRTRAIVVSVLSAGAVLLMGWEAGTQGQNYLAAPSSQSAPAAPGAPSQAQAQAPNSGPSPSTSSPSSSASSAGSGTFTGTESRTPYGTVQVQITVGNGAITDVTALHLTDADGRSVQISNRAAPVLRQEVLAAQSSSVHTVSGATYTSEGYLTSLQSAIDKAGL